MFSLFIWNDLSEPFFWVCSVLQFEPPSSLERKLDIDLDNASTLSSFAVAAPRGELSSEYRCLTGSVHNADRTPLVSY